MVRQRNIFQAKPKTKVKENVTWFNIYAFAQAEIQSTIEFLALISVLFLHRKLLFTLLMYIFISNVKQTDNNVLF